MARATGTMPGAAANGAAAAAGRPMLHQLFKQAALTRRPAATKLRLPGVTKAAMDETTGAAGGYTTPPGFGDALFRSFAEASVIYPRATVVDLDTYDGLMPTFNAVTAQTAGTAPWWGGVLFRWQIGQGTALLESEPTLAALGMTAWTLTGYAIVSNQLLEDLLPSTQERLLAELGAAAAWYVDYACLRGAGTALSQPTGVLNSGAAVPATRAVANNIAQADVAKMVRSLIPGSFNRSIWLTSPTALEEVVQVTGYQANMDHPDSADGQCGYLMSRPLFVTEKLPALGTAGDLALLDPTMYVVGLRREVTVEVSAHEPTQFAKNRSVIRVEFRGDGKPALSSTVTLADGTTVCGCAVILAA